MKRKGFTLIELLVVVAVIGVLSSMVFYSLSGYRDRALVDTAVEQVLSVFAVARSRTLASSGSTTYGVHLAVDEVDLFAGTSFDPTASSTVKYPMHAFVELVSVSLAGGAIDVKFDRLSAKTSQSGSFVVRAKNSPSVARTVSVLSTGLVYAQ